MFGITGYETYAGEDETMWFETMDEMMAWLAMFDIDDLNELTELLPNLWTM